MRTILLTTLLTVGLLSSGCAHWRGTSCCKKPACCENCPNKANCDGKSECDLKKPAEKK